eukprot:TRINITY_DN1972_c0_g1_i15.p1 TRINITY_DN1972_c0_g1~~TRINITY_DN1972_c0_g1_i15.p1  ORF type:complete len:147 (+),score=34.23 TRINITY_DN1972_c0_g1_i15:411-851(+)
MVKVQLPHYRTTKYYKSFWRTKRIEAGEEVSDEEEDPDEVALKQRIQHNYALVEKEKEEAERAAAELRNKLSHLYNSSSETEEEEPVQEEIVDEESDLEDWSSSEDLDRDDDDDENKEEEGTIPAYLLPTFSHFRSCFVKGQLHCC